MTRAWRRSVVALLVTVSVGSGIGSSALAGPVTSVGSTTCSLAFTARQGNLDCIVGFPGGEVDLSSEALTATVALSAGGSYAYDSYGRLAALAPAPGRSTSLTYDSSGRIVGVRDSSESATTFTFDAGGRITAVADDGSVSRYSYDAAGRVVAVDGPNGETVAYSYDELGRVVAVAESGATTSFSYSDTNLARLNEPDGTVVNYSYDSRRNLVAAASGADSASFQYDSRSNVTFARGSRGTFEYRYTRDGRVATRVDDSLGETTMYTYDSRGNLVGSSSTRGDTAGYTYDRTGSLVTASSSGGTVRLAYDSLGDLVGVSDARGNTTHFTYDDLQRIVAVDLPAGDQVVVGFESGDLNQPVAVGFLWSDGDGPSLTLTPTGKLRACSTCP